MRRKEEEREERVHDLRRNKMASSVLQKTSLLLDLV